MIEKNIWGIAVPKNVIIKMKNKYYILLLLQN